MIFFNESDNCNSTTAANNQENFILTLDLNNQLN